MNKQSELARNDIESGLLHKRSLSTLYKYRDGLRQHESWENDKSCSDAVIRKTSWLSAVNKEIEHKKDAKRARISTILDKVLAGLAVAAILYIAGIIYRSIPAHKSDHKELQLLPQQPVESTNQHSYISPNIEQPKESVEQSVPGYPPQGVGSPEP